MTFIAENGSALAVLVRVRGDILCTPKSGKLVCLHGEASGAARAGYSSDGHEQRL